MDQAKLGGVLSPGVRLFLAVIAVIVGSAAASAQSGGGAVFGRIFVIDPVAFQHAGRRAADGMLDDIERFERASPRAKLAIIYNRGPDIEREEITGRNRSQLRSYLISKLGLYQPAQQQSSTLLLNRVRDEIRAIEYLWKLSDTVAYSNAKRVVTLKVFPLRWHFDLPDRKGQLYDFRYPNACAAEYLASTRFWPGNSILDIEFRPPLGAEEPPDSAMMGFAVSLTGTADSPPHVHFRGAAGPYCDEGDIGKIPYIALKNPDAPDCRPGMEPATRGPVVQSCSQVQKFEGIAAGLMRRPVSLVTQDGTPGAGAIALSVQVAQTHRLSVTAGGNAVPASAAAKPLPGPRGSSVNLKVEIVPSAGCRSGQAVTLEAETFDSGQLNAVRERIGMVASDVPCAVVEIPLGVVLLR